MRPSATILLCALFLLPAGSPVRAAEAPPAGQDAPPEPPYRVTLTFSEPELDPSHPRGTVTCRVRNEGTERVSVPVGYDGVQIVLRSGQLRLARRRDERVDGDPKAPPPLRWVPVEPGREQVVFELPLVEILRLEETPDREWRWDWPRRPAPPRSPIHRPRGNGYYPQVNFQATVTLAGKVVPSHPVTLSVRAADSPK